MQSLKTIVRSITPQPLYAAYAALRRIFMRIKYSSMVYPLCNIFGCPFCGHQYRKFLADGSTESVWKKLQIVGGGYRDNARCLWCHSVDRQRLMYYYIKERTDLLSGKKKLLHIAPEKNIGRILQKYIGQNFISGDINPDRDLVKEYIDIRDIHYPDDSFDAIICSNVLEHILEDQKAMGELYRVLAPGGLAMFLTPVSLKLETTFEDWSVTTEEARLHVFGQKDHVRVYAKDFKNRLESAGFRMTVIDPVKEFGEEITRYFAFFKGENLYIGSKNKHI